LLGCKPLRIKNITQSSIIGPNALATEENSNKYCINLIKERGAINMLKKLLIMSVFIVACISNNSAFASENAPNEVQNAAVEGLKTFKEMASSDPVGFGFKDMEEVDSVVLGEAYPIFYLNGEKLKTKESKKFADLIENSKDWEFIVYVGNEAKTSIVIGPNESGLFFLKESGGKSGNFKKALNDIKDSLKQKDPNVVIQVVKAGNTEFLIADINGEEYNVEIIPGALSYEKKGTSKSENSINALKKIQSKFEEKRKNGITEFGGNPSLNIQTESTSTANSVKYIILPSILLALGCSVFIYKRFREKTTNS
jgi:hypothetical protein